MDCAEICGSRRVRSTDVTVLYTDLTLISLLLINIARQVAVCDWWTILKVSAWCETHVSNNSNFTAATGRDAMLNTTPTVCYSVPSIVEGSGGCQSVNICLRQRGITSIVKWLSSYAKSIDCENNRGFLRKLWIHRLRRPIHGSRRSTDCAQQHSYPYPRDIKSTHYRSKNMLIHRHKTSTIALNALQRLKSINVEQCVKLLSPVNILVCTNLDLLSAISILKTDRFINWQMAARGERYHLLFVSESIVPWYFSYLHSWITWTCY